MCPVVTYNSMHDIHTRYLLAYFIVNVFFCFQLVVPQTLWSTTATSYANHHKHDSFTIAPETIVFYIWNYAITSSWRDVMLLHRVSKNNVPPLTYQFGAPQLISTTFTSWHTQSDYDNFWQKCYRESQESYDALFSHLTCLVLLHYLAK